MCLFNFFGIKKIVVVVSGKGGVGKLMVVVNFVIVFKFFGLCVGIFDVDVYGFLLLWMFGLKGKLEIMGKKFLLRDVWGLKVMLIGLMVDEDWVMIW